ncbi:type II secretion system protein GspJ [Geomesophilobacter sediminis]|uniref:Type II secretion system protein J n=1 Tax=Geomesophilobacter sediminis TaxID=2798584 RepID=A0A8J7M199_9BACT|nr:type II secretion system protein GspJ [Geomesophilobacter sediminis]MBJ6726633.1 prepilin-type N-terminal cleavage/methylation domain-containing protein [Geomesophilobacter sediminis]
MWQSNKGFTLIELLMGLALLVILSGALYGTYFSVMRARERGGENLQTRRELSSTLAAIQNEIASSYFVVRKSATVPICVFLVQDRDSYGKPTSSLALTTIAPPRIDPAPASDLAVVGYEVREQEGGALFLTRESKDLYLKPKSVRYPVMENIDGFLVECYDGSKWVKSWDTSLTNKLPQSVRVTITLKSGESASIVTSPGLMRKYQKELPSMIGEGLGEVPKTPELGGTTPSGTGTAPSLGGSGSTPSFGGSGAMPSLGGSGAAPSGGPAMSVPGASR